MPQKQRNILYSHLVTLWNYSYISHYKQHFLILTPQDIGLFQHIFGLSIVTKNQQPCYNIFWRNSKNQGVLFRKATTKASGKGTWMVQNMLKLIVNF